MVLAFMLTFPGLALLVVLFGLTNALLRRLKVLRARGSDRPHPGPASLSLSSTAFDVFTASVNTGKAHELEERSAEALRRDEEGDGAPPRSTVDLSGGRAVIVVPRPPASPLPR